MSRNLRVRATRAFQQYRAGYEVLIPDVRPNRDLVRAGYFDLIAVEQTGDRKSSKPKGKGGSKSKPKKDAPADV